MFLSAFSEINDIFELITKLIQTAVYQLEMVDWSNKVGYMNKLCAIKKKYGMNTILRNTLLTVNTIALVASILWIIKNPDYEPVISTLVLVATLIGLWITDTTEEKALKQKQKGGKNSKNYQAGRDINIQK